MPLPALRSPVPLAMFLIPRHRDAGLRSGPVRTSQWIDGWFENGTAERELPTSDVQSPPGRAGFNLGWRLTHRAEAESAAADQLRNARAERRAALHTGTRRDGGAADAGQTNRARVSTIPGASGRVAGDGEGATGDGQRWPRAERVSGFRHGRESGSCLVRGGRRTRRNAIDVHAAVDAETERGRHLRADCQAFQPVVRVPLQGRERQADRGDREALTEWHTMHRLRCYPAIPAEGVASGSTMAPSSGT